MNPEGLKNEKNAHNCQAYLILQVANGIKKDVHLNSIQTFVCKKKKKCEDACILSKQCLIVFSTEPRKGHFLSDIYQKRN